jgi:uncharacterized RDD family membrane protein YckC
VINRLGSVLNVGVEVLIMPLSILSGFLLKRKDLKTRTDQLVYIIFSFLVAWTGPHFIMSAFPSISINAMGFLTFVCAVFGGLIILNLWRILSDQGLLLRFVEKYVAAKQSGSSGKEKQEDETK